jgi:hypothetical protein
MAALATQHQAPARGYLQRAPTSSGLADVLEVILDKGLVIDLYVRVSVVGIEILTIDARIVVASVDTYLRFAEAVNRLDLTQTAGEETLPELIDHLREGGASSKAKGLMEGVKEKLFSDDDEDEEQDDGDKSSGDGKSGNGRRTRTRARSSSSSSRSSSTKKS